MKIGVITLFPKIFESYKDPQSSGLMGKALEQLTLHIADLRIYGEGKHKVVDDAPYGGGDGMVLKAEPIRQAVEALLQKMNVLKEEVEFIFLCPGGDLWNQKEVEKRKENSTQARILLCGRYAGVDERILEYYAFKKISVGPYILNGGELPALILIESLIRTLPEALGNSESAVLDSFSEGLRVLEAPNYTRPQSWEGKKIPEELVSGDHGKIKQYRYKISREISKKWQEKTLDLIKGIFDDGLC